MGHQGNIADKIASIEKVDWAVGELYEFLKGLTDAFKIAVLPDHPTPCALRTHTADPVPFLICCPGMEPDAVQTYDEISCKEGGYGLMEKDEFMNLFMNN